jgi:hypothetical protein
MKKLSSDTIERIRRLQSKRFDLKELRGPVITVVDKTDGQELQGVVTNNWRNSFPDTKINK